MCSYIDLLVHRRTKKTNKKIYRAFKAKTNILVYKTLNPNGVFDGFILIKKLKEENVRFQKEGFKLEDYYNP